jgi:hypothetical protein
MRRPPQGEAAVNTLWTIRITVAAIALVFGSFSLPAHAQSQGHSLVVNIPFGFDVGSKHLPPGIYTVSTMSPDIVQIRNLSDSAMVLTHGGESYKPTKSAKLVFRRYGEHYFLGQVWFNEADTTFVECPKSKTEKLAQKWELASDQAKSSNVEVALLHGPQ